MEKIKKVIEETVETSFDLSGYKLNLKQDESWNNRFESVSLEDSQLLEMALKYDCSVKTVKLFVCLFARINTNNQLLNQDIRELAKLVL